MLLPDVALSLPCWMSQLNFSKLRQPTGQRLSNVRRQQKKLQLCQSYSYVTRKVWYHQIWIQTNLGFIVLILMYYVLPNMLEYIDKIEWNNLFLMLVNLLLKKIYLLKNDDHLCCNNQHALCMGKTNVVCIIVFSYWTFKILESKYFEFWSKMKVTMVFAIMQV